MLLSLFKISGHSMEPTILNGQTVIVSSLPYFFREPKIGDIIAFKKSGKIFIKRIYKIDNDRFFLIGDNKSDSHDSRKLGWIERKELLGKIINF